MPAKKTSIGIDVDNQKCRRCLYCVQLCPAKAIKIEKESIKIIPERCILCGSCVTECPQGAVSYKSGLEEVKNLIARKEKIIACLDPAFPVAFELDNPKQLVTALKFLGFSEVWEGAFGVDLISNEYANLLASGEKKSLISSFCPVIVFYIQKYLPQLIPNLAPIVSPMIAIGRAVRKLKGDEWKIVYITPCLAQMLEMVSPEVKGAIDQVITFRDLRFMLEDALINPENLEESAFDGPRAYLGRIVPVIGGLYRSTGSQFDVLNEDVSVTYGQKRAIGALNQIAQGAIKASFLDLLYCFGCVDGPFVESDLSVLGRRQLVARYTNKEMADQKPEDIKKERADLGEIDLTREFLNREEKLLTPTEEEIRAILKKIRKTHPLKNLDCRSCGFASCRDKAIAVAQGIADAEYCLPYLLEESRFIYKQLKKSHRELQTSHQQLEQAQAQLIKTEKFAALGQLAAGVAHEINNPLGTITIYSHLLLKSLEQDDPRREDVDVIVSEANRAKEIVQGLLSFARETKLRPGETDLNLLLEDVLSLVANQPLFHNISVKRSLNENLPTIIADAMQLKQVFLNIILNAAQAMEGKGKLMISTTLVRDRVRVRIHDTGPGIPPEHVDKLFSPFFTTKDKGTGLGLAISYGIIERHGGTIDVETKMGKGSAFIVTLPVSIEEETHKEGIYADDK